MDIRWWLLLSLLSFFFLADVHDSGVAINFNSGINITWGKDNAKIYNGGKLLTLSLDNSSGSAFASRDEYLFGKIDMQIKLVRGNSAGTVTALYLSSLGCLHDEVDFEFLGNVSGQPYTVHTNVYTGGKGDREMQFHVWFDPTSNFHTYTLLWNPQRIIWMIDGIPIRDFKNSNASFPVDQPMKLYSSIWDAENWATQGGRIKTNWSLAPFTAAYRGFIADACVVRSGVSHCTGFTWFNQQLGPEEYGKMQRVQNHYMIYDYCKDYNRFPHGVPLECNHH